MPTRDAIRGRALLAILTVLGIVLFSAACDVIIEDPAHDSGESGPRSLGPASTRQLARYEVAISAIDFDPPLTRRMLQDSGRPVRLVAAVENKGTMQLSRLTVVARIENQKGDFSEQDQVSIEKLIPGEARVVAFEGVTPLPNIPRSPSYRIRVAVEGPQLDPGGTRASREIVVRIADE